MRPHKLTMKAFGPFAKETVVDFDTMGNTVYLIAGDTGAGKTTIFDALVYALYGVASGSGRSALNTDAFHSDYAKHGNVREEMRVTLTFSEAGRNYAVTRRLYWGQKGDAKDSKREAVLTENGEKLAYSDKREKSNDVTEKIIEIVGMDAEQFRRIIMLAQGEFKRFLEAGSDERGVILGKIYGNQRQEDLQARLSAVQRALDGKIKDSSRDAEAQLRRLMIPEYLPESEKEKLQTDHPELLNAIERTLQLQTEKLEEAKKAVEEGSRKEKELNDRKTKGETNNKLLSQLQTAKNSLSAEEKKKPQMDLLDRKTALTEAAGKVLPADLAEKKAEREWKQTCRQIEDLKTELEKLRQNRLILRQDKLDIEGNCKAEIDRLQSRKGELSTVLSFYDDLAASKEEAAKKKSEYDKAKSDAEASNSRLTELEKTEQALRETLDTLKSAGEAETQIAERVKNDLSERLTQLRNLRSDLTAVQGLVQEERELQNQSVAAQLKAIEADTEYQRLYRAHLAGSAGLLAQELIQKLEMEETAPCPVCGVLHTKKDTAHFAVTQETIPGRDEVDAAQKLRNEKEQAARKAELAFQGKKQTREQKAESALRSAELILGITNWDELETGKKLEEETVKCSEQLQAAIRSYKDAVRKQKEKEQAQKKLSELEPAVTEARDRAKQDAEKLIMAGPAMESAEKTVADWQEKLSGYPADRKAAEAEIAQADEQIAKKTQEIANAEERLNRVTQAISRNEGSLAAAEAEQETRKKALDTAHGDYTAALERQKFSNEEAYLAALQPEGIRLDAEGLEKWLLNSRKTLKEYEINTEKLQAGIAELEESTAGMNWTDLDDLSAQLALSEKEVKNLRAAENRVSNEIQTNRSVWSELVQIAEDKKRLGQALKKVQPLAEAANAKYSFSRYVLTDYFNRIVEQANTHLDTMTDGEYQLVSTEDGDGRKLRGLGLRVLNTITNYERNTASLSGGQSFEASLALALGLSDVVQMESGSSIRIDSMFIDEGFGSLDGLRLDRAIEVLEHLSSGHRQIGLISHVARLEEGLTRKIRVVAGPNGSTVRVETDGSL